MTTFNYYIPSRQKRKDGTYNVKIRITHNRVSRYLSTNHFVDSSQITRSLIIKDQQILDALSATFRDMRALLDKAGYSSTQWSCDEVVAFIRRNLYRNEKINIPFYDYGCRKVAELQENTRAAYMSVLNKFHSLYGDMTISEITIGTARDFASRLEADGFSVNGFNTYIVAITTIYKKAMTEFNDLSMERDILPRNPFSYIERKKVLVKKHRDLSVEVIQAIIDYKSHGTLDSIAQAAFLASFSLCGANMPDLLRMRPKDGYVTFVRRKIESRSNEELTLRVEPEASRYLTEFQRRARDTYRSNLTEISMGMVIISKAIGTKATFYCARHTWATLARNEVGADKYTVHEALGHVDRSTAIDDVYIRKDFSRVWEANRKVLDLFNWSQAVF